MKETKKRKKITKVYKDTLGEIFCAEVEGEEMYVADIAKMGDVFTNAYVSKTHGFQLIPEFGGDEVKVEVSKPQCLFNLGVDYDEKTRILRYPGAKHNTYVRFVDSKDDLFIYSARVCIRFLLGLFGNKAPMAGIIVNMSGDLCYLVEGGMFTGNVIPMKNVYDLKYIDRCVAVALVSLSLVNGKVEGIYTNYSDASPRNNSRAAFRFISCLFDKFENIPEQELYRKHCTSYINLPESTAIDNVLSDLREMPLFEVKMRAYRASWYLHYVGGMDCLIKVYADILYIRFLMLVHGKTFEEAYEMRNIRYEEPSEEECTD